MLPFPHREDEEEGSGGAGEADQGAAPEDVDEGPGGGGEDRFPRRPRESLQLRPRRLRPGEQSPQRGDLAGIQAQIRGGEVAEETVSAFPPEQVAGDGDPQCPPHQRQHVIHPGGGAVLLLRRDLQDFTDHARREEGAAQPEKEAGEDQEPAGRGDRDQGEESEGDDIAGQPRQDRSPETETIDDPAAVGRNQPVGKGEREEPQAAPEGIHPLHALVVQPEDEYHREPSGADQHPGGQDRGYLAVPEKLGGDERAPDAVFDHPECGAGREGPRRHPEEVRRPPPPAVGVVQGEDQADQGDGEGDDPRGVDLLALLRALLFRDETRDEEDGEEAQGDVDEENPAPVELPGQYPAQERPRGLGDAGRPHDHPDDRPPLLAGIAVEGDDGGGGPHQRPADPLHDPPRDHPPDAGGEAAGERGDPEDGGPGQEGLLAPVEVPDPAAGHHQGGEDQEVAVQDPLDFGDPDPELLLDGDQGDIRRREVDADHEHRAAHGDEYQLGRVHIRIPPLL